MELLLLFGIVIIFIITSLIMPWVNHSRIGHLQREIRQLQKKIYNLKNDTSLIQTDESQSQNQEPNKPVQESLNVPAEVSAEHASKEAIKDESFAKDVDSQKDNNVHKKSYSQTGENESNISFEQKFGARLPVWIGGVALALAGFYLVKYSIEQNLLGPTTRVVLGCIFGIGLLFSAKWVRNKPDFSNGVRISQSLAGAGIAVLYVSSYAATRLYGLLPIPIGFLSMAGVTAIALVLSLRHGAPIALLGMAGGFLTPALMSTGSGNIFALFVYLYFTASGLLIVIRKTKWWWLSIPTILFSLLWVLAWLFNNYSSGDSIYLVLFLTAISATIIITSKKQYTKDMEKEEGTWQLSSILNYIGLGGTLLIMGLIGSEAEFGNLEWGLFGLLALGSIGLAYFNDKLYGFVPWVSMGVNAVMLFGWDVFDNADLAIKIAIFASIYVLSGYVLMFRSFKPTLWGSLSGITAVSYYLLAYSKLHSTMLFDGIPFFWGGIAFALGVMAIFVLFKIYNRMEGNEYKQYLYAIFTITATTFISLALFIELDREFLSVAIAFQMLALSLINTKVSISSIRPIIAVLACVFGFLILPQIILLGQLTAYSLAEIKLYAQKSVPIVNWPWFQLGLPAVMFISSAYLLCKQIDDKVVRIFEVAAIALFAVMGYYVTRNIMHPDENVLFIKAGFFERGVITNILFIYGLACMFIGRVFGRSAFVKSGIVLFAASVFRIVYFDLFLYNPLWESQKILGIKIFNSLLLPFGLPIIWSYLARKELKRNSLDKWANYLGGFILLLLFALLSLNVRHIFHGQFLNSGITSFAEIYTYSAVWLLLGVGMLFAGIIRKDKMLRYASLCVILFTIGKVFLYDASELEGLFRVFSFLGLGISLIGVSYFYTRFVFGEEKIQITK
jgi:uncharacterized membrane protein